MLTHPHHSEAKHIHYFLFVSVLGLSTVCPPYVRVVLHSQALNPYTTKLNPAGSPAGSAPGSPRPIISSTTTSNRALPLESVNSPR
jgi:hypothetical protein